MGSEGTPSPALLRVESAFVNFGPLLAVRDVSFDLRGGDLLGLIGPNGAGKTTLMRAVAGLQPLARGTIRVMDGVQGRDRHVLRHIGFTPDTPPMYEKLTVREFLRFIAMGYDVVGREADERIDFWLDKVWLREKSEQKITQLSRGMRQRVGIARTLLPNPSVILLDEPAAGLDPVGRAQFRQLLCSLRDQSKALIVSSHILSDMNEYCTHIGIMSSGQLVRIGTVGEIAGAADAQRCRYTILLARAVPRLAAIAGEIPSVSAVDADSDRLVLEYDSGRQPAANLLSEMIRRGLPVASFSANAATLEEAYLRTQVHQVE